MTDEQRRRIHDITYSTDDREELAERIVALEELCADWYELAVGGADSLTDWNHAQADLESRMDELGVPR